MGTWAERLSGTECAIKLDMHNVRSDPWCIVIVWDTRFRITRYQKGQTQLEVCRQNKGLIPDIEMNRILTGHYRLRKQVL